MLSISVVIPVYNEEELLRTCLDSIAAQTISPDEVIVVDNNSTDRSALVAASYSFVKVIKEKKQGISYARDAGFNVATKQLIGRLDADTVLPETWIEDVLNLYGDRDDFAFTGGGYFYNISVPWFNSWMQDQIAFRINRFIMGHYILWGSNMVMPRNFWQKVRRNVCSHNQAIHEDLDLAIHLHRMGCHIAYRENIKVGVKMKRVYGGDKSALRANLDLWPETLYAHGLKRAWLGKIGASILYNGTYLALIPVDLFVKSMAAGREQVRSILRTDP